MERKTCDYCGMEYDARLSQCPLCGRAAAEAVPAAAKQTPAGEEPVPVREKPAPARTQTDAKRTAYSGGGRRVRKKTAPVRAAEPAWTKDEPVQQTNPYAIPKWMMTAICVILGIAVLGGAFIAFTQVGWSPLYREPATVQAQTPPPPVPEQSVQEEPAPEQPTQEQPTVQEQQPVQQTPTEAQYTNEEDQKPVKQEPVQEQPAECTSLKLSAPTVTFEKADRFFSLSYERKPENCADPVIFTSSDEAVATVNAHGKIVAVNRGTAVITATCGSQSASCMVTCDFEYIPVDDPNGGETEQLPLALNNADMTFFSPGEQFRLAVLHAPSDAYTTFVSADPSIATVTEDGLITAKSSGTTTITVTVDGFEPLKSIVRCRLSDSAEQPGDASCTISNSDVTMGLKGESFQLTLKDASGNRISGLRWVSDDTSVCTVDEHGVVTAVGKGTTNVHTTYGGVTYTCIVRCRL